MFFFWYWINENGIGLVELFYAEAYKWKSFAYSYIVSGSRIELIPAYSYLVLFSVEKLSLSCLLYLFLKENCYDYLINSGLSH